jgi:CRP/FNR family transcriptional regulator
MSHAIDNRHDQAVPCNATTAPETRCASCGLGMLCLPAGLDAAGSAALDLLRGPVRALQPGEHVFHAGGGFREVWAVRSGCVKTYVIDAEGREQVVGFALPGDLLALDAIHSGRHPTHAAALTKTALCPLGFERLAALAAERPALQARLFELLSREIGRERRTVGDAPADARLARFLLALAERYRRRGYAADDFLLPMARRDIANYLGLAPETVSRLFRRLCEDRLIAVERKRVRIADRAALERLAG